MSFWGAWLTGSSFMNKLPSMPVIFFPFKQESPTRITSWMERMKLKLKTYGMSRDPHRKRSVEHHLSFKTEQLNRCKSPCVWWSAHSKSINFPFFYAPTFLLGGNQTWNWRSVISLQSWHKVLMELTHTLYPSFDSPTILVHTPTKKDKRQLWNQYNIKHSIWK